MTKVDTEKYLEFVKGVTREPSLDYGAMGSRLAELEVTGTNTSQSVSYTHLTLPTKRIV